MTSPDELVTNALPGSRGHKVARLRVVDMEMMREWRQVEAPEPAALHLRTLDYLGMEPSCACGKAREDGWICAQALTERPIHLLTTALLPSHTNSNSKIYFFLMKY